MSSDDKKFLEFGRMVFGLITDVINTPAGAAYGRRTVTLPDGRGGKHKVVLFISKNAELAEIWDKAAKAAFEVDEIIMPSSERTH